MFRIEHVSIQYKNNKDTLPVIRDLSMQIRQGEALVILGSSGCGKSTLINALAGSIAMESGSVSFVKESGREQGREQGKEAEGEQQEEKQPLNPKLHKIGLIPQNCGLLPWKRVRENCILPLKIRRIKIDQAYREEMNRIYEALNILHILDKYPSQLSGGQLQRAAIARAFILKPDLLLMDEPFSALDALTREEARELFLTVWKQIRPTTIMVTHSIEEALYLGTTICIMEEQEGRISLQMENPYFGQLCPQEIDYLLLQKELRERLKSREERKVAHE